MRYDTLLVVIMMGTIVLSVGLWMHCRHLKNENQRLHHDIATLETSRKADTAAMATYEANRTQATKNAKERRHALETITSKDSDFDVVKRCVGSLCLEGEERRHGTSTSSSNGMHTSGSGSRVD